MISRSVSIDRMSGTATTRMTPKERQKPSTDWSSQFRPEASPFRSFQEPMNPARLAGTVSMGRQPRFFALPSLREGPREEKLVDAGQVFQIRDRDPLVHLVHGLAYEAEFHHRAVVLDEPRVRRAAARGKFRPRTRHLFDRARKCR